MAKSKIGDTSVSKDTQAIMAVASRRSAIIAKSLKLNLTKTLHTRRVYRRQFEQRLLERWQKPIDLLEILIEMCMRAGAELNNPNKSKTTKPDDYLFYVLRRLHARACQISYEILSLLKAGFADGAQARWRTLYEIAVISYFITHQGQEIAKHYLQYEIVETYKEMLEYQQHCSQLGYEPLTNHEVRSIKSIYDEVIRTYGRSFGKPYGWIPEGILKKRTFVGIEKFERFDKLRPYYIMACHNVHSGPKGLKFRLGVFKGGRHKTVLLAGASNYGLADPGQGAAISLSQITSCLPSTRPTIRTITTMMVTLRLVDEIGSAFVEAQSQIEREERTAGVSESGKL
jgi:hypothetical protein